LKQRVKKLKQQQKGDVIATKKKVVGDLKEKVAGLQEASSHFGKNYSNKAGEGKGDPHGGEFLVLARRLMSTMISADQRRQQLEMTSSYFLPEKAAASFKIPCTRWWVNEREAVGHISWLHAMIKIAAAKDVKQFGFDETGIDCQSTMNEWCLIEDKAGELEVVHMETGGILCGGTSQECADHVEKVWARGNAAIKILRADLADKYGQEVADELVPDANGGVQLLKLRSAMHDTCNTANAVVPKLAEKKEASGKAFYGNGVCQKIGAVGLNSPVMGAPWSGLASLPGPRLSHPDSPVV
jgi:hypothetical protein